VRWGGDQGAQVYLEKKERNVRKKQLTKKGKAGKKLHNAPEEERLERKETAAKKPDQLKYVKNFTGGKDLTFAFYRGSTRKMLTHILSLDLHSQNEIPTKEREIERRRRKKNPKG